jgi:inner membrane transporter RhtA
LRVILAAIVLVAFWRPWNQPLSLKNAKSIGLFGVVLGCMNLVFYKSLETLPLGVAIAIEFTGPLTVAIASSRRLVDFIWIILAVIGLGLLLPIAPGAVSLNPLGIGFALTAAVLWATYILLGKHMADIPGGQATSLGMLIAACVLLPFGIIYVGNHIFDPKIVAAGLCLAIASSAIPYTLEMYAMKHLPKNTFSILLSMEPAVGALSAMVVLHESLSGLQWGAIASIMCASIGSAVTAQEKKGPETIVPADVL